MAKDLEKEKKEAEVTVQVSEEARDDAYTANRIQKYHKEKPKRLPPRVLYREVCNYLERELVKHEGGGERAGYCDAISIGDYIVEYQDSKADKKLRATYTTDYNVHDIIKGINNTIETKDKHIEIETFDGITFYKGYEGLKDDYETCIMVKNASPVEKSVFDLIKGALNFETLAAIRNQISLIAENAWVNHLALNPDIIITKKDKADFKAKYMPEEPFICIESSQYEFTEEYEDRMEKQRKCLMDIGVAIVMKKAVRITYQAFHYDHSDDLEFSPHYIRAVGGKLMVYGQSRSIEHHAKDQYKLVNLILSRILAVNDFDADENVKYYSAKELGIDYNKKLFYNRMTYDMPGFPGMTDACTRVLLKVRKMVQTEGKPKEPYKLIIENPLHHSQAALLELEENEFAYVSLFVKDYMFIKPILLPYGSDIAVVEPKELRDKMVDEIKNMVAMYDLQIEEKVEKGGQTMTASQS